MVTYWRWISKTERSPAKIALIMLVLWWWGRWWPWICWSKQWWGCWCLRWWWSEQWWGRWRPEGCPWRRSTWQLLFWCLCPVSCFHYRFHYYHIIMIDCDSWPSTKIDQMIMATCPRGSPWFRWCQKPKWCRGWWRSWVWFILMIIITHDKIIIAGFMLMMTLKI